MSVHKSGQESESTTATEGEKSDRIQDYHDGDAAQPVDNALKDAGSEHTPAPATDPTSETEPEREYMTGLRLFLVMMTINMSGLLTALEIGIIATAIPAITDQFHALDDVGWYGSATFLVVAVSSAPWGKAFKYLDVKSVYLASIAFFLLGSIVGGVAPTSVAVIVGRAIQGFGITGTMNGSIIVINYVSHPRRHPPLIGVWMAVFMVSTILGPVVGGALTSVSWRWVFYINLPLGVPIVIMQLLFLRVPKHIKPTPATWKEIILQLDIPGFVVLLASLVCFILALQWGGQSKQWSDGSVIATLVMWIVLFIIFVAVEAFQGERAMVPLRLLKPRSTWANVAWCFVSNSAFYQVMFYLPIYFQSVKGDSAIISGVNTLPFLAFFGLGAMLGGAFVGKTRHVQPFQLVSALLMVAGAVLLYLLRVTSSTGRWAGAQVLFGFAVGLGNQIPLMTVQGLSKPEDVPTSTGIMFMTQSGSAVYFIVVAQAIFANRMLETIKSNAAHLNPLQVLGTGASEITKVYRGEDLAAVLDAYMVGIRDVFTCVLAGASLAVLLTALVPLRRLPNHDNKKAVAEAAAGEKNEAV
ncbi:HC-toxin efflux carrier TOXA [Apiospora marii]|uniref:HC-toxin efflux carrier TOXA n=1 Tax=Apiospora marii TaxID=335849 RepID=A0ABR1RZ54_9PEZI